MSHANPFRKLLTSVLRRKPGATIRRNGRVAPLGLPIERLEDRAVPATITVTTLLDDTNLDGQVTLREAIQAAETDTSIDGSTAGAGADTIVFAAGLTGNIDLTLIGDVSAGPSAFGVTTPITIDGFNGAAGITIQRAAPGQLRLFAVSATGDLTLRGLTLANGLAQGGNGGSQVGAGGGGGGAAGMGGAIFNSGTLNIVQSTLSGNMAQGGNGGDNSGAYTYVTGAGGGGVGGNGGIGDGVNGNGGGGGGVAGPGDDATPGGGGAGGENELGAQAAAGANGTVGGGGGGGDAGVGGGDGTAPSSAGFGGGGGGNGSGGSGGGSGGFGGGGGGGTNAGDGGNGGFGGGGGGALYGYPGYGGFGGGDGVYGSGGAAGGGAGMGGALFNNGGLVTITNSTLAANSAAGGTGGNNGLGIGGAVFNRNGSVTILNATISGNAAADGGRAVFNLGDGAAFTADVTIDNSILGQAGAAAITDFDETTINGGTTTSGGGGNLIRNPGTFAGTVVSNADPLLGPLAFNGGPTRTMLPGGGSPAINAGDNAAAAALTTDQRGAGYNRIQQTTVDIGAVEVAPQVISITSTTANGTYGVGAVINVTVNFSEALTLAGGNLTITLDTGDTVVITPFTNATSTSGTYVVSAGDLSPDLNSVTLTLGAGATLQSAGGIDAIISIPLGQSLADNKDIVIDTAPKILSVTSTTANGTYGIGDAINVTVNFTEPLTLTGGNLTINLDTGGTVVIAPFTDAATVGGTYIVAAGQSTPDLNSLSPLVLDTGATLQNAAATGAVLTIPVGFSLADNKDIVIDGTAPAVANVTSATADGSYGLGDLIDVTVNFTEPVTLSGGGLTVTLDTGGTVVFAPFTNALTINGVYTVGPGQNTPDLNSLSLILASGAGLTDAAGNDANLTIPAGQSLSNLKDIEIVTPVPLITGVTSSTADGTYGAGATIDVTVNFSTPVTLTGGTLTINLDTGGTVVIAPFANSSSASGTYIVSAGQNSPDLNSNSPLVLSAGATLRDVDGVNAVLTIPAGQSLADGKDIVIDTVAPTVVSVTSATPDGAYGIGATIDVTLTFSEPVTLAGGNLFVNLNTGGRVVITPFTNTSVVTGTYTVALGESTPDLNSLSITLAAGATLRDGANDAVLTIPAGQSLADTKAILIDGIPPTVGISAPSATLTGTGPVTFFVSYSDVNFAGSTLSPSDITLNTTGTAFGTVTVSGTGATRLVTISNITGDGTIGISVAAGTATDVVGNSAPAAGPSLTFRVDNPNLLAVGGSDGTVRVLDAATGDSVLTFRPLDVYNGPRYTGLVQVAMGDFNGDRVADLFVSAANPIGVEGLDPSKGRRVFVYDGATIQQGKVPASPIRYFTPFLQHIGPGPNGTQDTSGVYINGLNIAVGDVNGDGKVDLVAGTRGGAPGAGNPEYGRLVVIDGNSPPDADFVIGEMITPFGQNYQKGVVVAVGNIDGVGGVEIAVTRGGPVAETNLNKTVKVKAFQFVNGALSELALGGSSVPFAPFAGIGSGDSVIQRDARVTFVDTNNDGKAELIFSALDRTTDPNNTQVRVAAFSVDIASGKATPVSTGAGPSKSYLIGTNVADHGTSGIDLDDLVMVVEGSTLPGASPSSVQFLDPLTGNPRAGGFPLTILAGGVSVYGF